MTRESGVRSVGDVRRGIESRYIENDSGAVVSGVWLAYSAAR